MKEIDCLGMRCPLPIIAVGREIKSLVGGETIHLLADDPATELDLRAWARMTGNLMEVLGPNEFLVTKSKVD
ncbi:MAG TPA: sulfurtransferase TusA family protein [Candidatus Nanopelagicaceae bacterium]|jgi:tRNA 2-thiouridine synthesizing protein A